MKNKYNLLFILIFIIYFFPYFYLGENFPLDVFDNMDSNISWIKLCIENYHLLFSPNENIPNLLGGVTSFSSLYPFISITTFFYWLVGYYWGFVISKMIMVIVGYRGMFLLLSKVVHIKSTWLAWALSISFSIIPFWGDSLNIIGFPLLAYCFYNIYNNNSQWSNWFYIFVFPFFSSLVYVGMFLLPFNGFLILFDLVKNKKINIMFLLSNIIFGLLYLVSHYPVLSSFFVTNKVVSHRNEMNLLKFSFYDTFKYIGAILIRGDFAYHGNKPYFNALYVLPVAIGFILMFINNYRKKFIYALSAFAIVSVLLVFFMYWSSINELYLFFYSKLPISWDRLLWFYPVFWIISVSIVFDFLIQKIRKTKFVIFGLVFIQTVIIAANHKIFINANGPSFKEFYSVNEFEEIDKIIGREKKSYRIMNIGIHPAVSHFNGFYSIDGFSPNYPLEYKIKYSNIIKNELHKKHSTGISKQFYNWGSWCYSYSEEVGFNLHDNFVKEIKDLDYDWDVAENLGVEYVISTASIDLDNLKLIKRIEKDELNYYPIFLYKIVRPI